MSSETVDAHPKPVSAVDDTDHSTSNKGIVGPHMTNNVLDVVNMRKSYWRANSKTVALEDISFSQRAGEFLVIVGPSGCGKTTTLRCIAHLTSVDAGSIQYEGRELEGIPEDLSVVFQDYSRSLFPWLSVRKNVEFALSGLSRADRRSRADEMLGMLGLEDFGDHYPWQLSGGMQQRVAIARGVVGDPSLLLMDEPFASVDAQTRTHLEALVMNLWERMSFSALFITHDIDEAVYLADRILVLSARPSRILREIDVDLPRPRDQIRTKASPEFQALRSEVFRLIESGEAEA